MKARTNDFKNLICGVKETKTKITYGSVELGDEQLNSIQPHYEGAILKSTMKQLDLDSNVEIPKDTIINLQFGVKVREASGNDDGYDYINYGNYIVKKSEKQEDTNSYLIKCYDKMLYSMVEYESLGITYPITIRDYINALCTHIGLTFKNANDYFTNYDKIIEKELYLDDSGNSLNYTFRDVLDELAQVTASIICINENDDELEIRYITNAGETTTNVSGTNLSITSEDSQVNEIELLGNTTQETTTGKNLLPNDLATKTVSGITITKNSDGTYKVNGTATADVSEAICNNFISMSGTWRMLGCPSGGSSSTYMLSAYVGYWGAGSPNIDIGSGTNITYTGNVKVRFYIKSGTTCNNLIFKPMLTTDTSTTTFERYTNGASPNPDYPQEVVNVTGRQEVKCVGTNLIGLDTQQYKVNLSAGDKITLRNTGSSSLQLNLYTNYGDSTRNDYWSVSSGSTRTITLAYNTKAIAWNINVSSNGVAWVNKGESILDYEPYKEETNEINLGKNLFNSTAGSTTEANLTVTKNSDGSYTLNGTSKSSTWFYRLADNFTLPAGTYTLSNSNSNVGENTAIFYDDNGCFGRTEISTRTFTEPRIIKPYIRVAANVTFDNFTIYPMIEKGSQATSYSEYFTPIELCKLGTNEDKIFKTTGKNLLDISKIEIGKTWSGVANTQRATILWLPIKANQKYNFVSSWTNSSITNIRVVLNHGSSDQTNNLVVSSFPFTNTTWEYASVEILANTTFTETMLQNVYVMLCEGTNTEYEPYGSGEWYVKKNIGKVALDGSETWNVWHYDATNVERFYTNLSDDKKVNPYGMDRSLSNKFRCINSSVDTEHFAWSTSQGIYKQIIIYINKSRLSSVDVASFKTWLGNNKTTIYYILATPTYTKITNTDLIEQLNSIRLLEGTNNVMSSMPIDLDYVSGIDTIDEEYFNEDNVNFGEMYGPVNTIILSRSAESDEIAQSIPSDLSDDEKVAIKIKENQIMNFDNRDEFLYGILTRLYGLRYTQNDYSSKGICYYNVCDRYKANIFGKDYYCVMLNDDVTIESGLSENVFTELPETAETDYSKTSTSDRIERQTTLIVDKQAGEIRGLISGLNTEINGDNGIESRLSTAETTLREDSATLRFITENTINEDGSVKALKTSTDYTFDSEGLKIGKSTDDYNSLQDNTGTYYYEKDTMIGKYTKDGSVQKDLALYGKYYYGIDEEGNFNVNTFERSDALFLAQLYTNSSNEEGFGHFYNGA